MNPSLLNINVSRSFQQTRKKATRLGMALNHSGSAFAKASADDVVPTGIEPVSKV
jgi:hypothetical protein